MIAYEHKPVQVDSRALTFSQAQGYEELPSPLGLEELPPEARTHIWNIFYYFINESRAPFREIGGVWRHILYIKHLNFDNLPLDEWDESLEYHRRSLRYSIETLPFNQVFDLIHFVIRHPNCPHEFIDRMNRAFVFCKLAYTIDTINQPTIIPSATRAEGAMIVESLQVLRRAGLGASESHLRRAAECINNNDWADSIRESIHAVESAARQLDPDSSETHRGALTTLEKEQVLHPALKEAFIKLYGYTSNEQGLRHALLDQSSANVGIDEAVFMLGACASFASYLWRKHAAGDGP